MEKVRRVAAKIPFLSDVEKKTNIKQEYILLSMVAVLILVIMSTSLGPLITSTFGIVIPLRESLLVLKQVNPKKDELRHFMVFWMVFGVITALDAISGKLMAFIPLFYTLKFGFLLWAGPLRFRGGLWIYDNVLVRIPEEYYKSAGGMDSAVNKATEVVREMADGELQARSKKIE